MKSNVSSSDGGTLNPKFAAGLKKVNLSHVSCQVIMGLARAVSEITKSTYSDAICTIHHPVLYLVALGMMEGSLKYGRHNYRAAGVNADTYYGATCRHIDDWWHGEDVDPYAKGNMSHVSKGMSSLHVILDGLASGMVTDDRPPRIGGEAFFQSRNFFVPKVRVASVCYAEIKYHLMRWWEGEDFDKRSRKKNHHLYLAMAWMHELMKGILEGSLIDDRPNRPRNEKWMEEDNARAVLLLEARGDVPPAAPFTEAWAQENRKQKFASKVMASIEKVLKQKKKTKVRRMTVRRRPTRMKKVVKAQRAR